MLRCGFNAAVDGYSNLHCIVVDNSTFRQVERRQVLAAGRKVAETVRADTHAIAEIDIDQVGAIGSDGFQHRVANIFAVEKINAPEFRARTSELHQTVGRQLLARVETCMQHARQ